LKIEELLLTKDKEETSTMQEKLEKKLHDLERKHSIIQKGIQEIDKYTLDIIHRIWIHSRDYKYSHKKFSPYRFRLYY